MARMFMIALILVGLTLAVPGDAQPAVSVSTQFLYAKSLTTGEGLPVLNGVGVSGMVQLNETWSSGAEIGLLTPTTKFDPAPYAALNLVKRVNDGLLLSSTAIGRYVPANGDRILAATLAPVFPVTKGLLLIVSAGPSYNVDKTAWAFGMGVKFSFRIY